MTFIRVEQRHDTTVIFFARPPANAFDLHFTAEFEAHLRELAVNPPSGGVVITGDGRIFSGGVDFKAVPTYTPEQHARMIGHINSAITTLYGLPTATVAAVNGHAIGGAFVVMLACDVRLAADTEAKLGLTEVTAGIPYPACPMEVVKAEIEPSYRRHLVLTGEIISPRTAHAHGLIDQVLAPQDLLPLALGRARTQAAALSYGRVKQQLKHDTLTRMREIVATSSDPMLGRWV